MSLSMTDTFTHRFSKSCRTDLNPAQHFGDIWMYLIILCNLLIAPNARHLNFIHAAFSFSDTFAVTAYVSKSLTLGPNNSPLTAICISCVKHLNRCSSTSNPTPPSSRIHRSRHSIAVSLFVALSPTKYQI